MSHAAPELEALLPGTVDGHRLAKGSATGAVVLSGEQRLQRRAEAHPRAAPARRPADLTFANAQDRTGALDRGRRFRVRGPRGTGAAGRDRPQHAARTRPGLAVTSAVVGGRRVTKVVYASGATLYLYPHRDVVYYVGTQNEALAETVLQRLSVAAAQPPERDTVVTVPSGATRPTRPVGPASST